MRKIRRVRRKLLWLFFISLIILSLLNYNSLSAFAENTLKNNVESWGYYSIAAFVFLIEFIPQPFLSAWIPFIIGVVLDLNYVYLILISIGCSIPANYLAYFLGRKYGKDLARTLVSERSYNKSVKLFDKYGKTSIAVLAFTPLPYFPILGGVFRMSFKEFTKYAIIPRTLHFIIFLLIIKQIL